MFARSFTQATRGAVGSIRRYATEAPKTTSRALPLAGVAAAASVGAYYYLQSDAAPSVAKSGQSNFTGVSAAPNKVFTGGDQGFVSLKLESTENVSHNVKKLRFHLGDDDAVSGLDVASAVLTKYKGPEMEKAVLRPYTPTSDEDAKGYLEFIIKKYPNGPMSTHMFDLVPGQRLDVKGPLPKYNWTENKHEHVAMITGGTGITPMWQLCRAIFKNPNDKTKVTLVFGNISEEDIILKQELAQLENDYPQRFRAFYTLDKPSEGWQQGKGHITKELLQTVLPDPKKGGNVKAFVCGPPGLYKAVSGPKVSPKDQGDLTGYLADLGWTKEQVFKF